MFSGVYQAHIDRRGRFTLPLRFRQTLSADASNPLIVTRLNVADGFACLAVYPVSAWDQLLERSHQTSTLSPAQAEFDDVKIGGAFGRTVDHRGRTSIPSLLLQFAKLKDEIILVGVGAHFRIWDQEIYDRARSAAAEVFLQGQVPTISGFGL